VISGLEKSLNEVASRKDNEYKVQKRKLESQILEANKVNELKVGQMNDNQKSFID